MNDRLLRAVVVAGILALTACSDSSKTAKSAETEAKKEAAGPPEAVPGKEAFYAMYKPARAWAADVIPLSLKSGELKGVKNSEGKAGLWTGIFVSPGTHQARTFYYAVAEDLPLTPKGVRAGAAVAWGGPTPSVMPFQLSEFSVDSDDAYKAAASKAAPWLKTHPDKLPEMTLGNATRFPAPVWYLLWGTTKDGYAAYVSAVTGNIVGK